MGRVNEVLYYLGLDESSSTDSHQALSTTLQSNLNQGEYFDVWHYQMGHNSLPISYFFPGIVRGREYEPSYVYSLAKMHNVIYPIS